MSTPSLKGVGAALVTPFNADKSLDIKGFERLLAHTMPYLDYLVINGTTAESPTLAPQELQQLLATVKQMNDRKLPVVLGLGGNYTAKVLQTMEATDFTGIDAILSASPAYNKPTQEGIYQHYTHIADACPVPVVLYNVPGRTSSNLTADTTIKLSKHPNIIGIKEASGNLTQCLAIAKHTSEDFLLISGDDLLTIPVVSIGGVGAISVIANAFPKQFCAYVHCAMNGDYTTAQKLLAQQLETNELLFAEGNPAGVKMALHLLGVCEPYVRLPLVQASEGLKKELSESIKEIE